jgi:hypothetical protein
VQAKVPRYNHKKFIKKKFKTKTSAYSGICKTAIPGIVVALFILPTSHFEVGPWTPILIIQALSIFLWNPMKNLNPMA